MVASPGFCALRLPSALRPPSFDMRLPSAGRPAPSIVRPVVHRCSPVAGSAPASAPVRPDRCWHNGWTLIIWPAVPAQIVAQVCPVCAGPALWRTGAQTPHGSRPDSKRQGASRGHGREVCVLQAVTCPRRWQWRLHCADSKWRVTCDLSQNGYEQLQINSSESENQPRTLSGARQAGPGTRNADHGKQNTEHGARNTANGTRKTEPEAWSTENGTRSTEHGPRSAEHGTRNTEH